MKDPATLRIKAGRCADASAAMTIAARHLELARQHAQAADCTPLVADSIQRAQSAISSAQGAAESRRLRLLRKADAKEQASEP